MTKTAYVEIRSQHSVGSSGGRFGGPDTYVTVQVVPDDQTRLRALNQQHARTRGIRIIRYGEGYSEHRSSRSMLGRAIASAHARAAHINHYQDQVWVQRVHRGEQ